MIARYVTSTYEVTAVYKKILLDAKNAGVKIEPTDENTTAVSFFERKRQPYEFFVQDDTLILKPAKARWYHFLRIGVDRSRITLCVPRSALEAISVRSNVGRVDITSVSCSGTVDIQTGTGSVNLENVCCKAFDSKGNTGSASLNNLVAKERIFIKRNTGKVLLNDCFAPDIVVKTNTGSVCGRLPANMAFAARTNTGKIAVPKMPIGTAIGGRCEIKTNTGSIKFE